MPCSLRDLGFLSSGRSRRTLAAASLTLLISLDLSPVRAAGAAAPQQHAGGRGWKVFLTRSAVSTPTGVAIDLRGAKRASQWGYVADAGTGRIVKFGTGGRVLRSWRYSPTGHPAALTVGGAGNLFVADRVDGNVLKFSPGGKRLALWTPRYLGALAVPPYSDPSGITVDPAGRIYVAEHSAHTIIQLTPGGTLLRGWDTSKGFTTQYSVPHQNSGPFGDPTGVVYDPPGHLFISTVCVPDPACRTWYTPVQSYGHETLLVLATGGAFAGYVGNFWFGLGYSGSGTPTEMPGKESEPFVHIDAMVGDGRGHAFLAGTMWPRGGQPSFGVLSYTDLGHRTAPWRLPSEDPIAGVAVDSSGSVYVSQGTHLLKRSP
jgi:NHL repeat